jgi:hypothetical protein
VFDDTWEIEVPVKASTHCHHFRITINANDPFYRGDRGFHGGPQPCHFQGNLYHWPSHGSHTCQAKQLAKKGYLLGHLGEKPQQCFLAFGAVAFSWLCSYAKTARSKAPFNSSTLSPTKPTTRMKNLGSHRRGKCHGK